MPSHVVVKGNMIQDWIIKGSHFNFYFTADSNAAVTELFPTIS